MILLCPSCHTSVIKSDAEVTVAGGPDGFTCDACGGALGSMESLMGVSLARGQDDDSAIADDLAMTMKAPALARPVKIKPASGEPDPDATLADADPDVVTMGSPRTRRGLKDRGTIKLPDKEELVSDDARRRSGAWDMPVEAELDDDDWVSKTPDNSATTQLPPKSDLISGNTIPVSFPGSQTAMAPQPTASKGGKMGLVVGCATIGVVGILLAVVGAGAWFMLNDSPAAPNPPVVGKPDAGASSAPAVPARKSLADRLQEAANVSSEVSIPAIALPARPTSGEIVLVTRRGVIYGGQTLAQINAGRIDPAARPAAQSPFVTPVAQALEKGFGSADTEDMEQALSSRWVLVILDSNATYRAFFPVLYTGQNRGARLGLIARHPSNPNLFSSVEVIGEGWPGAAAAAVPDALAPLPQAASPDKALKVMVVTVNDNGLSIRRASTPVNEAELLVKDESGYPWAELHAKAAKMRADGVGAVRLEPAADARARDILHTISVVARPKKGVPQLREIRLAPVAPEG
jgi:hypothetical protein